jgi:hypothetical protein
VDEERETSCKMNRNRLKGKLLFATCRLFCHDEPAKKYHYGDVNVFPLLLLQLIEQKVGTVLSKKHELIPLKGCDEQVIWGDASITSFDVEVAHPSQE